MSIELTDADIDRLGVAWYGYHPTPEGKDIIRNWFESLSSSRSAAEAASAPAPDMINRPPHYQGAGGMEAIDVIEAFGHGEGFCAGNVVKYVLRYKGKNGAEDLKKAKVYLDWLIGIVEGEGR